MKTQYDLFGNYVVSYDDDAPHIPTLGNTIQSPPARSPVYGNFMPAKSARGISPELVVAVILTVFGISFISNCNYTLDNTDTYTQNIEMTDEEKVQIEIEKSTAKFAEGRYRENLEICNNITELYPDNEISGNMSNYIKEQYIQYPSFTAKQLMAEYEANIVNADEKYTGKVMIISGTVSGIDKTNHDNNLCVLLKSGTYFKSVQLNFDTSQTESVSALKEGDNVKVLGKCTGKSGKQFMVFDGENVMIEGCLFIN